jgi:hypothetical protein
MIHGDHLCKATVSMPSYDAVMVAGERCRGISGRISTVIEQCGIDIELRRLGEMLLLNLWILGEQFHEKDANGSRTDLRNAGPSRAGACEPPAAPGAPDRLDPVAEPS